MLETTLIKQCAFWQVCFNFKQQLTVLTLMGNQERTSAPAKQWVVGGDVIDIRIAQFLLTPDSPAVTDSPEVELIRQEVGITFSTSGS